MFDSSIFLDFMSFSRVMIRIQIRDSTCIGDIISGKIHHLFYKKCKLKDRNYKKCKETMSKHTENNWHE